MRKLLYVCMLIALSASCEKKPDQENNAFVGKEATIIEPEEFSDLADFVGKEVTLVESERFSDLADYVQRNKLGNYLSKINGVYYEGDENIPFTGKLIYQIYEGQTEEERIYEDGKKIVELEYYDNGNKRRYSEYKDRYLHGKYIYWYENGKIESSGYREKDPKSLHGIVRRSMEHGTQRSWYENGKIRSLQEFNHGIPHGKFILWYENGQKQFEWTAVNGEQIAPTTYWDKNGNIMKAKPD